MKTLYLNGPIYTMESPRPVSALLVKDGTIAALGPDALFAVGAKTVDLQGRALLPAFLDAHSHLAASANALLQVPLGDAACFEDIAQAISGFIRRQRVKPGQWVMAQGYDHNQLAEQAHPSLALLDQAAPHNPVAVQHSSGHMGVFNSLGLAALHITPDTPDPEGGHIGRSDGALTGYLEESAFVAALQQVPMPAPQELLAAFQQAQRNYAAHGISTVQEGMFAAQLIPLYRALLDNGLLELDVVGYPGLADFDAVSEAFSQSLLRYHQHFKIGGLKLFLDGSPQGRTAWLRAPYEGETDYRGYPTMAAEEVESALRRALALGIQPLAHCNGDGAVRQYLEAGTRVERDSPQLRDLRPVIIHAQLMGTDQLPLAKALGFTPSFFVAHVYHWGDIHLKNFGPDRASAISPAGTALALGLPFTFHQAAPVIPPDMLETVWCAVNRVTRSGAVLGPEQRIPVYEALRAVTANAAWQYFEENSKGTLAPGRRADLVILDQDPMTAPPERLREIQVLSTIKGGKTIYEA